MQSAPGGDKQQLGARRVPGLHHFTTPNSTGTQPSVHKLDSNNKIFSIPSTVDFNSRILYDFGCAQLKNFSIKTKRRYQALYVVR